MEKNCEQFTITDDGIKLNAKLDMPYGYEEGSKCPLVIVIHGLTGHIEERHITAVADTFNKLGFATLRTDMYGHGNSEGEFEDHNLFRWLNNIMRIMEYARSLDFVSDFYIAGHSQGGLTSALTAGMYPDVFKAAILLSPASMVPDGAREGHLFIYDFDPCHIPDEMYVNTTDKVKGDYIRAAQLLDLDGAVKRFKNPVLIVHGDEDEGIPDAYSRKLAEKYENAELVIINGEDHCYNYHLDQVLDSITDFMRRLKAN